jgi:hypothetical protein
MKRKVTVLVLASLLLVTASAMSQEYKQALRYEIKGGPVSSFLISNDYNETGVGWGWTAGGGLFLPFFTKYLGVQIELMYTEKNASLVLGDTDVGILGLPAARGNEYDMSLTYAEVPLLAQLAFFDAEDFRGYLLGGVVNSVRLSDELKYTDEDGVEQTGNIEGVKDHDIGPLFGVGMRANRFLVEIRFNLGLRKLGGEESASDSKISSSAFLIGFSF